MRSLVAILLAGYAMTAIPAAMAQPSFPPEQICAALARQTLPEPTDFQLVEPSVTLDPANRARAADGRMRVEVPFRDKGKGIKIATCVFKDGVLPDFMAVGERLFTKAEIEEFGRRLEAGR